MMVVTEPARVALGFITGIGLNDLESGNVVVDAVNHQVLLADC
jgi:hypothetical protein